MHFFRTGIRSSLVLHFSHMFDSYIGWIKTCCRAKRLMVYVWQILDFSAPAVFICLFSLSLLNANLNSIRHWFQSKQNKDEINFQCTDMYLMQTTMNYSLCIFYISQMYFRVNGSLWWRCSSDLALEVWGLITEMNWLLNTLLTQDSGFHFKFSIW